MGCRFFIRITIPLLTVSALFNSSLRAEGQGKKALDPQSLRCLAETLYWEGRSEGRAGMIAIGMVVLNRVKHGRYPRSVCGVVRQRNEHGCQFSCWCDGRPKILKDRRSWELAQTIATELLQNPPADNTLGSLFYHAVYVRPTWSRDRDFSVRIGKHIFYR